MQWQPDTIDPHEIEEIRKQYREWEDSSRELGYDGERAVRFVIDTAGAFEPPVLDVGTGGGLAAVELARRGVALKSVDLSEEQLRLAYLGAREAGVEDLIEFYNLDANRLPFPDAHFGLVTMVNTLHHLEHAEEILGEVSRVLKQGGKLLLSELTEEGFDIVNRVFERTGRTHQKPETAGIDDVADLLPRHGLRCIGRDQRYHEYVMIAEKFE
jgi:ubiquinone/menaquinone biosynthesis C-methylase UbiE